MSQSPDPQSPPPPEPASEEPDVVPQSEPESESDPAPMDVAAPEPLSDPVLPTPTPTPTRKPANNKRKKSKAFSKYVAMAEQKLAVLKQNLKPVPFSPLTSLPDLSKHESLFRALGLWDFARLKFDQDLRSDLIASLIAFYDQPGRKSMVNGVKISVSRADLARALSLPGKPVKKKPEESPSSPDDDLYRSDEAGPILSEFISSYMIFHLQEDDDACILPQEVAEATRLVKEGRPDKVYWAGLIWGFVEKELQELPETGICYYASHLQQLIKHQHPELLEQVPEVSAAPEMVPQVEASADVTMEEAEDEEEEEGEGEEEEDEEGEEEEADEFDGEDGVEKTKSLEELANAGSGEMVEPGPEPGPGLSLGVSGDKNSGFEGGQLNWGVAQEKGEISFGHALQPCGSSGFGFESLSKPGMDSITEVDEEGEQYMRSFQRMDSSTDLLQAMENVNNANLYGNGSDLNNPELNTGDFLSINGEANNTGSDLNNPELNSGNFLPINGEANNTGSFFFTDSGKRPLTEIDEDREEDEEDDDEEEEEGMPNMQAAKRMRSGTDNWNFEQPSDFYECIERARACYSEKSQAFLNAQMQVQYLTTMVQEKDQVIHQLQRSRFDDQQKYNSELSRYEQEMNIMAQLVSGYKQALKKARHNFSEYRKKYPEGEKREKRLYGDVPIGGGLVICTKELERQKLERENEMKQMALSLIVQFQNEWLEKFEGFGHRVSELERRAGGLGDGIEGCSKKEESKENLPPSVEGTEM